MKTEDLYKLKNECCGCGLCSQSCPKEIIKMEPDKAGFLYPLIKDDSTCVNYKKCLSLCPMKSPGRHGKEVLRSFSFSLNDSDDLKKSASGGLVTEISRRFINLGSVVYGAQYSNDYTEIEYARATSVEELERFRGSKYVQAYTKSLYASIRKDLQAGIKVLVVGLPCLLSAVYHAFGDKDNLFTIALICHGPTSQKVHKDYCSSVTEPNDGAIKFMSVRYKLKGWKPYFIHIEYENGRVWDEQFNQSDYNTAFLYLKRLSCRTCQYKAENSSFGIPGDLVAGDFHAANPQSSQYNKWGVSQGSIMTEKGGYLSSLLFEDYDLPEIPYGVIRSSNRGMYMPIPQRGSYDRFVKDYSSRSLSYACHSGMVKYNNILVEMSFFWARIKNAAKRIIGGIIKR